MMQTHANESDKIVCLPDITMNAARDIDLCGTLKVGGGGAVVIYRNSLGSDYIGALCASDAKGVGNQYVSDGKLIAQTLDDNEGEPVYSASIDTEPQVNEEATSTLQSHDQKVNMVDPNDWVVRGLTPRECERLQGFPDDWTKVPYRGKPAESCPDSPRYKAIGNSMAVPVIMWLGERIEMVNEEVRKLEREQEGRG